MSNSNMTTGSCLVDVDCHQSLSIRIAIKALDSMPQRPGEDLLPYTHNTGQTATHTNCASPSGSQAYPFTTLVPAQAGEASRRHSMTVQHMLNPSDEEPRPPSQSRSSQSSDNDSGTHLSSSQYSKKSSKTESNVRSGNTSRGMGRGQARGNQQAKRRANRQPSLSSSGSEVGENKKRTFRRAYTLEETHFIWYILFVAALESIEKYPSVYLLASTPCPPNRVV